MILTGLVSVTFRKLLPEDIIKLVSQAGLQGIEWGGDIHVPHGNVERAREILKMTENAGLRVASYGSYYKVGCEDAGTAAFDQVLETAAALKAPTIRVWAGNRSSEDSDETWRGKVAVESRRIAALAEKAGISVAFEYHKGTLTDTSGSACRLLKDINHKNMRCYWQPPAGIDFTSRFYGLKQIVPWLSNIHVYYWLSHNMMPLADGMEEWLQYVEFVKGIEGDRFCMLEFVKDGSPEQFLKDAETLKRICGSTLKK